LVLEPQSLRDEIRAEAEALQESYTKRADELEEPVRA
jgi:hypothetical protein